MKFEVIDGCPVPTGAVPVVRAIKAQRPGLRLNSCYRGDKATSLLKRLGKSTQSMLWYGFLHHLPGYNPANPPGRSTHELFNDGSAFPGPVGMALPEYKVGMDWSDGASAAEAGREAGLVTTLTYPNSRGEAQHVNCRKKPRRRFRTLKKDSHSARVETLQKRLRFLGYLSSHHKVGRLYGERTAQAVKYFQRDHHLKADGVYGIHTHHQLLASYRWHKRNK